ncbi:PepSY domain-containing protein [Aestuariicoccus sp. MJ-SS9]|uniref:PepSY domain-containing protein n=1 Tax=Aestuariicoccus sp. MJ-SS9 TaxID=3079855 RepID=UPI0029071D89|nr:PepSY domain-containing protein [Aestuariicoccus sp. MJ-SS9]MDU8912397.1 PepSY domain-containing protein [Aestuariicoccus sp. MJ-SS9]
MTFRFIISTAAAALAGSMALADAFSDAVIADFRAKGFAGIEVKNGPTQTKVEAVLGNRKTEAIYDRATGQILKQEWEMAEPGDRSAGVEVRNRNRDFLRASGGDDNSFGGGDDEHGDDHDDDHDKDHGPGHDDDDHDDDHGHGSDHGGGHEDDHDDDDDD